MTTATATPCETINRVQAAITEHLQRFPDRTDGIGPVLKTVEKIADRAEVIDAMQQMIDGGEILIQADEESWFEVYIGDDAGQFDSFKASEAVVEWQRKWDLYHSEPTQAEKELQTILHSVSFFGSVRTRDLIPALARNGWTTADAQRVLHMLNDRCKAMFYRSPEQEIYLLLEDGRIESVGDAEGLAGFDLSPMV